ncbi:MAG TPA: OmpA family protein [Bacteroidaceae bacterium]|nr:OmpA family protein [Bacteroidaceae bacterium]
MKTGFLKTKVTALLVCVVLLCASCNADYTTKGTAIGAGGGAAIGALVGALIGHGKGAAIGAAIGTAVGAGAGSIIGNRMDKAAAEAAHIQGASVERVDINGLPAVKVTLDGAITFATNKATLNAQCQQNLSSFAAQLDPMVDLALYGYTDNTGPLELNKNLSFNRANAVANYLTMNGISASRIKDIQGLYWQNPIANNSTAEGRAQNRRVELYILASEAMIKQANEQAK